jgi:HPt (histidine-containing phosphotransfer) domain-containing protein
LLEIIERSGRFGANGNGTRGLYAKRSVNQFRDWLGGIPHGNLTLAADIRIEAMPYSLEQVAWMSSPPLVPDDGPIDFDHLSRMTLSDNSLEREVLAMFAGQATELAAALAQLPPNAAALAHKLKGSARAIGAVHVATVAADLETAFCNGADTAELQTALNHTVSQACKAIDAILRRS